MTFEGWNEDSSGIHRSFDFTDFSEAWHFMGEVAALAEELDHHPDWSNRWNRVSITLVSHDVARVTDRDRTMAARIDEIFEDRFGDVRAN